MIKIFVQVVSQNKEKDKNEILISTKDGKLHGLIWCEPHIADELKRRIEGGNDK
jgi:hypothetical protein